MANSNGRLFVASYAPNDSAQAHGLTELMGSEFRFPFRFRYGFYSNDAAQPSRASYPGEDIKALIATSLSGGNVAQIYALTNRSINVLDGLDAFSLSLRKRVAPFGTLSPWANCEDTGRIFWLDQLSQVNVLDVGGIHNLSRSDVDDQLQAIDQTGSGGSQVLYTAMAFSAQKLYLSISKSGASTNGHCLVYDTILRTWVSLDVPPSPVTFEGFLRDVNVATTRIPLLVLSSDQKAYRYDMPGVTTDLGSAVSVQIQSRDFTASEIFGKECSAVVQRMRVECDDSASGVWTWTVTYRPSGSTRASTINVDVSTPRTHRWDDPSSFTMTENNGGTCVGPSFNILGVASLAGGTNVYDIGFESEFREAVTDA